MKQLITTLQNRKKLSKVSRILLNTASLVSGILFAVLIQALVSSLYDNF